MTYQVVKTRGWIDKQIDKIDYLYQRYIEGKRVVQTKSDEQRITLFSIRIDPKEIDRYAEDNKIKGSLTHI
jgi:hypothetical protein